MEVCKGLQRTTLRIGYGSKSPQVLVHMSIRATQFVWLPFFLLPRRGVQFFGAPTRLLRRLRRPRHSEATARAFFGLEEYAKSRKGELAPQAIISCVEAAVAQDFQDEASDAERSVGLGDEILGCSWIPVGFQFKNLCLLRCSPKPVFPLLGFKSMAPTRQMTVSRNSGCDFDFEAQILPTFLGIPKAHELHELSP